jgi:hypothetical protein
MLAARHEFGPALSPLLDETLLYAWELAKAGDTDAVEAFERVLPLLIRAGYAEANRFTWQFTAKGIERAEAMLSGPEG